MQEPKDAVVPQVDVVEERRQQHRVSCSDLNEVTSESHQSTVTMTAVDSVPMHSKVIVTTALAEQVHWFALGLHQVLWRHRVQQADSAIACLPLLPTNPPECCGNMA